MSMSSRSKMLRVHLKNDFFSAALSNSCITVSTLKINYLHVHVARHACMSTCGSPTPCDSIPLMWQGTLCRGAALVVGLSVQGSA